MCDEVDQVFNAAVEQAMANEGYASHDYFDRGGPTIFGISSVHFPEVAGKLGGLPRAEARDEAKRFYYREFWVKGNMSMIRCPTIATKLFDMMIHLGRGTAVKMLQRSINDLLVKKKRIKIDGILGPCTAKAVNDAKRPDMLRKILVARRVLYYIDIVRGRENQRKYLVGWINRA